MLHPQPGILPEPGRSALFIILRVDDPSTNSSSVARVAGEIPFYVKNVAKIDPRARTVCTVGFGSDFWDRISPNRRPSGLRPFRAIEAEGRRAPATGGDLLLHLLSGRHDLNFELARRIRNRLGGAVEVMEEVHGFRYLDSRDITGFIDGTENPKGKHRAAAALIGKEDPGFACGSYVFTQRYVHNLESWSHLSDKEQEKVIGRRKRDSKELPEKLKPPTAHISRVVVEEEGRELEIVRHSFPYGTVTEAGLFFIAYTKDLSIPEKMLARMIGTNADGLHDHLMDHTCAVSGATFFAPSLESLKSLGRA
ncbi:MAG TPA: Dyp-type peroxidase [bacterium]|nr:Dyp-type peroxidase [bacterium]